MPIIFGSKYKLPESNPLDHDESLTALPLGSKTVGIPIHESGVLEFTIIEKLTTSSMFEKSTASAQLALINSSGFSTTSSSEPSESGLVHPDNVINKISNIAVGFVMSMVHAIF